MLEYLRMKREIRDLKKKMAELEDKMSWLECEAFIPLDELRSDILCLVRDIREHEVQNTYLKENISNHCSNIEAHIKRLNRSGSFSEKYADYRSKNTNNERND